MLYMVLFDTLKETILPIKQISGNKWLVKIYIILVPTFTVNLSGRMVANISNGNRTEWSPIWFVIIRVITKWDDHAAGVRYVLFITSMITD